MNLLGLDSETHLIRDGMPTPKPVVWSFAKKEGNWLARGADAFKTLHDYKDWLWALFNAPFDLANASARDVELMEIIFKKYERGEIFDCMLAMALDAVAEGRMLEGTLLDRDGHGLTNNLEGCTYLYTGRKNAKENDAYKLLYGDLDPLPTEQWPQEARQYPLDDARNTFDDAEIMLRVCQNLGPIGVPGRNDLPLIKHDHLTHNCRAHYIMHLGSIWGLRCDEKKIIELEGMVAKIRKEGDKQFRDLKFIKTEPPKRYPPEHKLAGQLVTRRDGSLAETEDGKDDGHEVKRRVIFAYGGSADSLCEHCAPFRNDPKYGIGRGPFGSIPKVTKNRPNPIGNPTFCKECDGTGLFIPALVPRSKGGGVCSDKDVLKESSDPDLEAWAKFGEVDKLEGTYLPTFRRAVKQPLNTEANPLLATARTAYKGVIQLIPPIARECVIPLEGGSLCSIDLAAGELCTLGQVCFTLFGQSRIRDVINSSKDPGALHSVLGGKMGGIDTSDPVALALFILTTKDKTSKAYALRQLAKVANFGFPGLMGAVRLVLNSRIKGEYLCRISGMNKFCKKGVTEWNGKQLERPCCPDCLEVATQLRIDWLATWPEITPYFNWVKAIPGVKDGMGVIVSPLTGYVRGGLSASAAANHSFQHLLAYAKKQAMWEVGLEAYTDKESPLYGMKVLGDIHDELFTWIPKTPWQHEAAFREKEIIISACKKFIPDVEVVADDPALMGSWQKKAVATYDGVPTPTRPKGTLIEWTPEKKKAA